MPIQYKVVPNYLTNPPSFTARPVPGSTLDYDGLAKQINLHNPTIPVEMAKAVLKATREEVIRQLVAGNTVNLSGFISFVTTLPVRLKKTWITKLFTRCWYRASRRPKRKDRLF
ncbi:MAG: hypothetical protein D3912_08605 [Candidatus Electrothrix sp. AX1]|nr:hypothetical protein [Candidatus Electrothrix sp. AX1]